MISYLEFEKLIAYYCAPCLMGLKSANLLAYKIENSLLEEQMKQFHQELSESNIRMNLLCQQKTCNILLIYNIPLLEKQLYNSPIQEFLLSLGYPCGQRIEEMLEYLSNRINQSNEYPHEIGLFLGYPLEDVLGFIQNHGKHYKLCGYWKVYTNEIETLKLFNEYSRCRSLLYHKIIDGFTLKELHTRYSSQTNELHKSML